MRTFDAADQEMGQDCKKGHHLVRFVIIVHSSVGEKERLQKQ